MKQTYEQRVSEIVEKMKFYSTLEQMARIAVAEMAEAYEWGHHDGWMSKAMNFNQLDSPSLKEGKIKSGLIPDDGQEDGKPEPCPHELRCHTRNHPEGTCDCHNMGLLPEREAGSHD